MTFEEMLRHYVSPANTCRFSPVGRMYQTDNAYMTGEYWYYAAEDFLIDIQVFSFHRDYLPDPEALTMYDEMTRQDAYVLISNYYFQADIDWFAPNPMKISDNSVVTFSQKNRPNHYIARKNSRMVCVGLKYRYHFFEALNLAHPFNVEERFFDAEQETAPQLRKIAIEIMRCQMEGVAADLFFESKAMEWASIMFDCYQKRRVHPVLSKEDSGMILRVVNYIDNHCHLDIPQSTLEAISLMGGTKLKRDFHAYTGMTITEYTQRKRIDRAEHLLKNTSLPIKEIAFSVGYNSPSRFSQLFYRYCGLLPGQVRRQLKS